jgi:hypothetical protein
MIQSHTTTLLLASLLPSLKLEATGTPQMFANLLHCRSGIAQTDLSGTLISLDDSTPKNMSKLMALGHKTFHDLVLDNNFMTSKLAAIPQAGNNWDTLHRYHIAFTSFESPNGYFQNLGLVDFQISEQMFVSGNMQNPETISATQLVPQPSPKTSQFPQLLQIFFLYKSPT